MSLEVSEGLRIVKPSRVLDRHAPKNNGRAWLCKRARLETEANYRLLYW